MPIINERLLKNGDKNQDVMEDIYEKLCANIYKEVLSKEALLNRQQRSRDTRDKDLYMEQCYVCGILGYHKFLSTDRLSVILGWQLTSGCYGSDGNRSTEVKRADDEVEDDWAGDLNSNTGRTNLSSDSFTLERVQKPTRRLARKLPGMFISERFLHSP